MSNVELVVDDLFDTKLEPGHPYLRLPLQFSVALEPRLLERMSAGELAALRGEIEAEWPSRADGGRRSP